jgi:hypothetical protein
LKIHCGFWPSGILTSPQAALQLDQGHCPDAAWHGGGAQPGGGPCPPKVRTITSGYNDKSDLVIPLIFVPQASCLYNFLKNHNN